MFVDMQPHNNTPGTLSISGSEIITVPVSNYENPVIITDGSTVTLSGTVKFTDKVKGEWSNHGMICRIWNYCIPGTLRLLSILLS